MNDRQQYVDIPPKNFSKEIVSARAGFASLAGLALHYNKTIYIPAYGQ